MGIVGSAAFALLVATLQISSAWAAAPGGVEFEVLRNGAPFGRHVVSVREASERIEVESRVELRVGVGPLTLFLYEHGCNETWRRGALSELRCTTLRDGRRTQIVARRDGSRLRVAGEEGEVFFPVDALPTSWWIRPPIGDTAMIDTETGARLALRVTDMGPDTVQAGGVRISAQRIRVQGRLIVDLWYDAQGRWVGCAFTARGQRIVYRLASPHDAARG